MGVKIGGTVEKVNGKELSYTDFVENYLTRNQPVILTGLTDDWRACKDWVSDDGKPNLRYFSDHFGGSTVQVADCGTKEFTDQKRLEMSVSEFIDRWMEVSGSDNGGDDCDSLLYLKDWHFVKEYPEYIAYNTPIFFLDDWLNLYLDKYRMHNHPDSYQERNEINCSDYRFVYMGAKGTWTPLHADVFRSYSWSANVCGRKKWYFLSPTQHHLVFDRYMKSSVYNIFEEVCEAKYPGFKKEDTISINHNWFNAYNISWVVRISDANTKFYALDIAQVMLEFGNHFDISSQQWDLLLREYHEAKAYIEDIKDICDNFEGLCQRNLAANAGMDFSDFFIFIIRFALANLVLLYQLTNSQRNINWSSSQMAQLLLFNLKRIQSITVKMKSEDAWVNHRSEMISLRETVEDQSFVEFCDALGRTYSKMIYGNSETNFNLNQTLLEFKFLDLFGSRICNPDELVTFIASAFKLLGTES
ncbi:hypothetical protein BUALT_Bualt07G0023600 [Buddleja alternifolia]|uniref:JmjC domain-containing protein n=1 Tax=Buddleja alternifolia TaxID=168488 RepID=A0AAV6XIB7_9LAMI|nr:hypothetical protein BUALT_Bualt07G0023600 [Buddleja alternifolia]